MRWLVLGMLVGCGGGPLSVDDKSRTGPAADPDVPTDTDTDLDTDTVVDEDGVPDFRAAGDVSVTERTASMQASTCTMDVDLYEPDEVRGPPVVLSHGFQRGRAQMRDWGRHLASWGIPVLAPQLCHATAFDTNHVENAQDLAAIAASLNEPVVYAGHSAGGLASLLAAANDSTALAVVGLDTTDANDLGRDAAPTVAVPVFGLLGGPSSCNSQGNGGAIYRRAPVSRAARVLGANHCDFESPTDWACTSFCGGGGGSDAEKAATIRTLLTAAVLATDSPTVRDSYWLPGGAWWDALRATGAIEKL